MTEDRLAEIEARLKAATPGPWRIGYAWGVPGDFSDDWRRIAADEEQICGNYEYEQGGVASKEADAALIANAPDDIADLLAEVRQLRDATTLRVSLPQVTVSTEDSHKVATNEGK